MPDITQIPAPRVPIIDQQTGLMSREWYRFFVNIFSLTGNGSNNVSLEDLQVGPPPVDLSAVGSVFTASTAGLTPASGGGTSNFLRADGTFTVPISAPSTTTLTGDVTGSGTGTVATTLASTAVIPGAYTLASITVDAKGRITDAANGTAGGTPGGANTQVQFNNASAFAGDANFTYDNGGNILTVGSITGSALPMTIQPKAPTVLEDAGLLTIQARDANASRANAGGGSLVLQTGAGTGTAAGGSLQVLTGNALGTGTGGDFVLTLGQGLTLGGTFSVQSGVSGAEAGATFNMQGGQDGVSGGLFSMGAGYGGSAAGGSFTMYLGGGTTDDGYMEWQDPLGSPFMRFQTATPGGAKQMGFFAATPVAQRSAYTQTFSTASRTVSNPTFTNLVTTAATNITPFGFTTAGQANDIATKVNQLAADVVILRQLINSLIDDSQAYGLSQ
jgi:hypothetical protein